MSGRGTDSSIAKAEQVPQRPGELRGRGSSSTPGLARRIHMTNTANGGGAHRISNTARHNGPTLPAARPRSSRQRGSGSKASSSRPQWS
jgi:hypothetical protein